MLLYLVQHAEALSKGEDPERSLSQRGIDDITRVAHYISELGASATRAVHSGKARAYQTAQILAKQNAGTMEVVESDGLAPMDDPDLWYERLGKADDDLMIVGHLPHLSKLTGLLLCGNSEKNVINFAMGSVLCLSRSENGIWSVEGFMKPDMIQ